MTENVDFSEIFEAASDVATEQEGEDDGDGGGVWGLKLQPMRRKRKRMDSDDEEEMQTRIDNAEEALNSIKRNLMAVTATKEAAKDAVLEVAAAKCLLELEEGLRKNLEDTQAEKREARKAEWKDDQCPICMSTEGRRATMDGCCKGEICGRCKAKMDGKPCAFCRKQKEERLAKPQSSVGYTVVDGMDVDGATTPYLIVLGTQAPIQYVQRLRTEARRCVEVITRQMQTSLGAAWSAISDPCPRGFLSMKYESQYLEPRLLWQDAEGLAAASHTAPDAVVNGTVSLRVGVCALRGCKIRMGSPVQSPRNEMMCVVRDNALYMYEQVKAINTFTLEDVACFLGEAADTSNTDMCIRLFADSSSAIRRQALVLNAARGSALTNARTRQVLEYLLRHCASFD
jgi:hypothetical protein